MARLATDGAEVGDLLFFDGGTSNTTNVTTSPSSGSRCYLLTGSGAAVRNISSVSELYLRTRYRPESAPGGVIAFMDWRNAGTTLGSVGLSPTLLPVIRVGTTTVETGDISFVAAQYTLVEAYVRISNTSGSIQVLMDGILAAEYQGDTQPGTDTEINNIRWTGAGISARIDDIGINDTTGVNDNSWCGDGHVLMMVPDSAGDVTELSRGGTDTGANWSQVNEIPPNSDTTYVYSTGSGLYDLYGLTSGSSIVSATDTIARVYIEARVRETAAEGDPIRLGIKSSGSEYWTSDISVTTSYVRYESDSLYTNPVTGLPWTIDDLNNLQVGYKVV